MLPKHVRYQTALHPGKTKPLQATSDIIHEGRPIVNRFSDAPANFLHAQGVHPTSFPGILPMLFPALPTAVAARAGKRRQKRKSQLAAKSLCSLYSKFGNRRAALRSTPSRCYDAKQGHPVATPAKQLTPLTTTSKVVLGGLGRRPSPPRVPAQAMLSYLVASKQ